MSVEMLQIFVHPREANLAGHVHFLERAEGNLFLGRHHQRNLINGAHQDELCA